MSPTLWGGLLIAAGYLCGSIPTGVLLARARGVDIRAVGSGNIGATNVARSLGKKLGAMVLLCDAVKGALPTLGALLCARSGRVDLAFAAATGLAAICGHVFPVWLRFRGGKGVATALGVFMVLDPAVMGLALGLFVAVYAAFHVASVGSLVAAVAVAALERALERPLEYQILAVLGVAIIVVRHRGNLRRLLRGEENKV